MKINKKLRIKDKRNIESIVAMISLYGLTKDDLANRQKLDEAYIRLNADLALTKLIKAGVQDANSSKTGILL